MGSEAGSPASVGTAGDEDPLPSDEDRARRLVEELGSGSGEQLRATLGLRDIFRGWLLDQWPETAQWSERRRLAKAEPVGDGPCFLPGWVMEEAAPALLRLAGDAGAETEARAAALDALQTLSRRSSRFRRATLRPLARLREEHEEDLLRCLALPAGARPASQHLLFHALYFLASLQCQKPWREPWELSPRLLAAIHQLLRRLNRDSSLATLPEPRLTFHHHHLVGQPVKDLRYFCHIIVYVRRWSHMTLLRPALLLDHPGFVRELLACARIAADPPPLLRFLHNWLDPLSLTWSADGSPVPAHRRLLFSELCLAEGVPEALLSRLSTDVAEGQWTKEEHQLCRGVFRFLGPEFSAPVLRNAGLGQLLPRLRHLAQWHPDGAALIAQRFVNPYDAAASPPPGSSLAHIPDISFPLR